ncbi:MAG: hypothetical protein E7563_06675 [Ruminococcaceae bacterium]|nr:hypothetical protein [Oscillospiraceae bacterium]
MFKKVKKSIVAILLICIFMLFTTASPINVMAEEYSLTDYTTDIPYSIDVSNNRVTITSANTYDEFSVITPVIGCCVYNGVFSFLSYTEENSDFFAYVYIYDIDTKSLLSYSTTLKLRPDETRFTFDCAGSLYLVDFSNDYIINRFSYDGTISAIECDSQVRQLMCLDGTNITVISAAGIYTTAYMTLSFVSDVTIDVPCYYAGNGYICDNSYNNYIYEKGGIYSEEEETTVTTPPTETTEEESSSSYDRIYIDGSYVYAPYKTTVAVLRKTLGYTKDNFTVYKKNGSLHSQGRVGTGMTAVFDDKTYTIIVLGEVTGEGNINTREINLLLDYKVELVDLEPVQKMACDINADGEFSLQELVAIARVGWGYHDTVYQEYLTLPVS